MMHVGRCCDSVDNATPECIGLKKYLRAGFNHGAEEEMEHDLASKLSHLFGTLQVIAGFAFAFQLTSSAEIFYSNTHESCSVMVLQPYTGPIDFRWFPNGSVTASQNGSFLTFGCSGEETSSEPYFFDHSDQGHGAYIDAATGKRILKVVSNQSNTGDFFYTSLNGTRLYNVTNVDYEDGGTFGFMFVFFVLISYLFLNVLTKAYSATHPLSEAAKRGLLHFVGEIFINPTLSPITNIEAYTDQVLIGWFYPKVADVIGFLMLSVMMVLVYYFFFFVQPDMKREAAKRSMFSCIKKKEAELTNPCAKCGGDQAEFPQKCRRFMLFYVATAMTTCYLLLFIFSHADQIKGLGKNVQDLVIGYIFAFNPADFAASFVPGSLLSFSVFGLLRLILGGLAVLHHVCTGKVHCGGDSGYQQSD